MFQIIATYADDESFTGATRNTLKFARTMSGALEIADFYSEQYDAQVTIIDAQGRKAEVY